MATNQNHFLHLPMTEKNFSPVLRDFTEARKKSLGIFFPRRRRWRVIFLTEARIPFFEFSGPARYFHFLQPPLKNAERKWARAWSRKTKRACKRMFFAELVREKMSWIDRTGPMIFRIVVASLIIMHRLFKQSHQTKDDRVNSYLGQTSAPKTTVTLRRPTHLVPSRLAAIVGSLLRGFSIGP